jgi:4-hydroxybenzoyl-CoA thioesterase
MAVYERPVRFEEVDAAGVVFFAHFLTWCHEAMEDFFNAVPGGYVGLIMKRRIGFPAVHVEADFKAPLRYGDKVRITTSVAHVGTTSITFRYTLARASDDVHVATIEHIVVATNLDTMTKHPIPDDCRAICEG